jgi:hypothetical protein
MRDNGLIVLSAAIVIAATVFGLFHYESRVQHRSVAVVGMASRGFDSDIVKWQISLARNTSTQNMQDGYTLLKNDITAVVEDLTARGIERNKITVQPLNTNPIYEREGISGYHFQQILSVVSDSLDLVENLALNPESIASRGILIEFSNLQYFYSGIDSLKVALLGEATRDARRRATEIAGVSDTEVGPIQTARAGVFQITEPFPTDVESGGIYNTASRQKDIRVTVHVTFSLK